MSAIASVALADLRQRTRTFGLLLVLAAALQLGYLFVPEASATYATIDLDGWRGLYNSAWMGASTALLTVTLLPLAGFFVVRPALHRDAALGVAELVACAPLGRRWFILGKLASNFAFLAAVALLMMFAAAAMQFVRGENRMLDAAAYLLPYLIVTMPACLLTAAAAIIIDSVPPLRGIGGGVVWFFVWNALLAIPLVSTGHSGGVAAFDPFGYTLIGSSLLSGLHAVVPHVDARQEISVGFAPARHLMTFTFASIRWTFGAVATRVAWTALAVALCALVAPFGMQAKIASRKRRVTNYAAQLAARLPLPALARLELVQALDSAGVPWTLGMLGLVIAALVVPDAVLVLAIAPLIWIWPVGPVAALSVNDARGLDAVFRATPMPAIRRVLWRWFAAFALAAPPVAALGVRVGWAGFALIAIAAAGIACGVALGAFTRAPLAFQSIALLGWYLGPVNRVPFADPATSTAVPFVTIAVAVTITLFTLAVTAARSSYRH